MNKTQTLDRLARDVEEMLGPSFRATADDSMVTVSHLPYGIWPVAGTGLSSVHDWTPKIDYRRTYDAQIARDLAETLAGKFRRGARDPRFTDKARVRATDAAAALAI